MLPTNHELPQVCFPRQYLSQIFQSPVVTQTKFVAGGSSKATLLVVETKETTTPKRQRRRSKSWQQQPGVIATLVIRQFAPHRNAPTTHCGNIHQECPKTANTHGKTDGCGKAAVDADGTATTT